MSIALCLGDLVAWFYLANELAHLMRRNAP